MEARVKVAIPRVNHVTKRPYSAHRAKIHTFFRTIHAFSVTKVVKAALPLLPHALNVR
jgi:hypothetical protein